MSGKLKKPLGLESWMNTNIIVLTSIRPSLGACKRVFSQCPLIALCSKMCHPSYYSPSRSTESLGKRWLFLLGGVALVLGASKGRGCMPNLNHTCREICVISLATFIIPICRWIASKDNPAAEPSRSKRYRPSMHFHVDQCRPSATGSAPDAELLAVLSAEAARVASEETQTRKQTASRSCAGVTNQNRGRMEAGSQATRRKRACTSSSTPFSIPSSASRPSSSRTESPQLRSNATRPRSTSSWPLQKCRWTT